MKNDELKIFGIYTLNNFIIIPIVNTKDGCFVFEKQFTITKTFSKQIVEHLIETEIVLNSVDKENIKFVYHGFYRTDGYLGQLENDFVLAQLGIEAKELNFEMCND